MTGRWFDGGGALFGDGAGGGDGGAQQGSVIVDADWNESAMDRLPGAHSLSNITLKRGTFGEDAAHTPEWTNPGDADPGLAATFVDDLTL